MNDYGGNEHFWRRAPTPCGRTRREFFWEAAGGFVGTALATLLAEDGFFAAIGRRVGGAIIHRFSAGPQGAAISGQGQGMYRLVHVRWRQSG